MKPRKVELHVLGGCKGCTQLCLNNRSTATREVAELYIGLFACNTRAWKPKEVRC